MLDCSQAVFAPSITTGRQLSAMESQVAQLTSSLLAGFNSSLQAYRDPALAGTIGSLPAAHWRQYNAALASWQQELAQQALRQGGWVGGWVPGRAAPLPAGGAPSWLGAGGGRSARRRGPGSLAPAGPACLPAAGQPEAYISLLHQALALYQDNSVFTLGQQAVLSSLYSQARPICNGNSSQAGAGTGAGQLAPQKCPAPPLLPPGAQVERALATALP